MMAFLTDLHLSSLQRLIKSACQDEHEGSVEGKRFLTRLYHKAIEEEEIDIMNWLFSINPRTDLDLLRGADYEDKDEIVSWLKEKNFIYLEEKTPLEREFELCEETLKFIHDHQCRFGYDGRDYDETRYYPYDDEKCTENLDVVHNAALLGELEILKCLLKNGFEWYSDTCAAAAYGGFLDILKYCHENGCPWDRETCENAAWKGNLEILKYAHENGCPWSQWTCAFAAAEGHLEVLKYAHGNGCPWDERTFSFTVYRSTIEVVRYLHENGCPWNQGARMNARLNSDERIWKYLDDNGCPK